MVPLVAISRAFGAFGGDFYRCRCGYRCCDPLHAQLVLAEVMQLRRHPGSVAGVAAQPIGHGRGRRPRRKASACPWWAVPIGAIALLVFYATRRAFAGSALLEPHDQTSEVPSREEWQAVSKSAASTRRAQQASATRERAPPQRAAATPVDEGGARGEVPAAHDGSPQKPRARGSILSTRLKARQLAGNASPSPRPPPPPRPL